MVDRFSKDGTAHIASARGAKVIQRNTGRSIARNIGLENCSSNGVLFVDSDMGAKHWKERSIKVILRLKLQGAFAGALCSRWAATTPTWKLEKTGI